MKRIRSKLGFKKFAKQCAFCDENNYNLLDVHRILEGHRGGKYQWDNCVCVCANHHRMIHSGDIIVIKKHKGYGDSLYVLEYVEKGENKLKGLHY